MKSKPRTSNKKKNAPAKKSSTMKLFNAGVQKNVSASAKKSALKKSGKTTRVLGHVQAAGQRRQARRDAKNR